MSDFSAERFLPHVGEVFRWRPVGEGLEVGMRLLEVERYRPQPGLAREPFSLLFGMEDGVPLGTGLHEIVHDDFEPCELGLSRVSVPERERMNPGMAFYEAVFS